MKVTTRKTRRQQKAERRATRKIDPVSGDNGFSNVSFLFDNIHTIWDVMDRYKNALAA